MVLSASCWLPRNIISQEFSHPGFISYNAHIEAASARESVVARVPINATAPVNIVNPI